MEHLTRTSQENKPDFVVDTSRDRLHDIHQDLVVLESPKFNVKVRVTEWLSENEFYLDNNSAKILQKGVGRYIKKQQNNNITP